MPVAPLILLLAQAREVDVGVLVEAYDRLGAQELWPGFEPTAVPLMVHDGSDTWLLRHPSPPEGFEPVEEAEDLLRFPGRHELARSNTSVALAGTRTATMVVREGNARSADELAAVLLHEAFHVFQYHRHEGWPANEVSQLVYPTTKHEVYVRRLTETLALQRALAAESDMVAAAWALRACAERGLRFAALEEDARAYERHVELHEGTARHLQFTALGRPVVDWTADGFGPTEVRDRCYASGHAWALLLDRFALGWKQRFESGEARFLDEELERVLTEAGHRPADLDEDDLGRARIDARTRLLDTRLRLGKAKQDFLERPGWRVEVVAADGRPLWPNGFDPLDVEVVGKGEVLHGRWIVLGNDAGEIEVLDRAALSFAAGKHPLFQGVSRLVVTGFEHEPAVSSEGGAAALEAEGLMASFEHATIERSERKIVVRL